MINRKTKGFTLIELLVVIAIIGILATIVLVSLNTARQKARDTRRVSDMRQIALALEMYYDDHSLYPGANATNCGDWGDLDLNLEGGSYMTNVPADPGGGSAPYAYDTFNNFSDYVLRAQLEQQSNTALNTDVDTNPVGGVGGCDCTDPTVGVVGRYYCVQP